MFSALLLILTCVRLGYTLHLPRGDTLNGGVDFYGESRSISSAIAVTAASLRSHRRGVARVLSPNLGLDPSCVSPPFLDP